MLQEATRVCKACGETKPVSAYYKSRKTSCADCVKRMANEYRTTNLEVVRAYDRTRGQLDSRKAENRNRYKRTVADPELRARYWQRSANWRAANTLKRKAHILVGNAVKGGHMKRPAACTACGCRCVPHAHHEDYTKPLEVTWLCKPCHGKRHQEINEMKRSGVDLSARGF